MSLYQQLSLYYDELFPVKMNKVHWIWDKLGLQKKDKILDLGCGTGDYVLSFAKQDIYSYGIDNDHGMIDMAINKIQKNEITGAHVAVGDMLQDYPFNEKFNGIFCIGNTLPHVNSFEDVYQCLQIAYNYLNPKGRLLVQTVNFDQDGADSKEFPVLTARKGQVKFYRQYRPHNEREDKVLFETLLQITDNHENYQDETELLILTKDKLTSMLERAGFQVKNSYCGFEEQIWNQNCSSTVILAEKM
ncbi:class I SAM-dependent methyltransferase [Natranaerobius thermophilus]|uniref:Methyltransferase type 11 n=1 Tax=Natranaerobius thermophilus (strain ATCC BAA-1301 / DSM 18059 / JW/NM-WN-LF) TaxID=457570 RepID=B2A236_NATTJ|nr:class I SAM-dependent methyltransferase [Natranaerobius thermophilus]ACB84841.1 Methyltransferase type 11 [Natranaerobius thermophilus JW/NM-WN-LF]